MSIILGIAAVTFIIQRIDHNRRLRKMLKMW